MEHCELRSIVMNPRSSRKKLYEIVKKNVSEFTDLILLRELLNHPKCDQRITRMIVDELLFEPGVCQELILSDVLYGESLDNVIHDLEAGINADANPSDCISRYYQKLLDVAKSMKV